MFLTLVASVVLLSGSASAPLEIEASLSGYNLPLLNDARCCAFRLMLMATRKLSVDVGGRVTETTLTPEQVGEIRLAVEAARFFSLPKDVPPLIPVDGDEHRMRVRIGRKQHTVVLYDWPQDWTKVDYLSSKELDETRRAHSVWKLLRALVKDAKATVE